MPKKAFRTGDEPPLTPQEALEEANKRMKPEWLFGDYYAFNEEVVLFPFRDQSGKLRWLSVDRKSLKCFVREKDQIMAVVPTCQKHPLQELEGHLYKW